MLATTRIKNLDSKANLLGYEFAEFTGKLYGLNNTLVIVGNTLENIGNLGQSGTISGRQPRPRFGDSREGKDFEHYIR